MRRLSNFALVLMAAGLAQVASASTYSYTFDTGMILEALTKGVDQAETMGFYDIYIRPSVLPEGSQYTYTPVGGVSPIPSGDDKWVTSIASDPLIGGDNAPFVRFTYDEKDTRLAFLTKLDTPGDIMVYSTTLWGAAMPGDAKFGVMIESDAPLAEAAKLRFSVGGRGENIWAFDDGSKIIDFTDKAGWVPARSMDVSTPEPATFIAAGAGLAALLLLRKKRKIQ
jgi:hypothetical protein